MYVESVNKQMNTTQTKKDNEVVKNKKSTDGLEKKEIEKEAKIEAKRIETYEIENEKLKKVMQELSEQLPNSEPKFGIHEETNRVMIRLVDKDTKEVIREFPSEKTLDILAKSLKLAGVLVDEKL